MNISNKIVAFLKKPAVKISILYFLFSRIIILIIGYLAIFEFKIAGLPRKACGEYCQNKLLGLFGNFDTGWYLEIAKNGYPKLSDYPLGTTFAQYNFFPLYPAIIKSIHLLMHVDYFYAALIISNLCLIASSIVIYKIAERLYNVEIAKNAVAVLFATPVSFLLSGAYSESLFLVLSVSSIFFALKGKWVFAGLMGMLATLTRPIGVFVILPLLMLYLQSINFSVKSIRKNSVFLLLIPLGVIILMTNSIYFTGKLFLFANNPHYSGGISSPISILIHGFTDDYTTFNFLAFYAAVYIIVWILFYKHIRPAFHLIFAYTLLIPLSYGLMSMPRMLLVCFPFILMIASIAHKYKIQQAVILTLSIFQGYLLVCWFLGFGNVI